MSTKLTHFRTGHRALALCFGILACSASACSGSGDGGSSSSSGATGGNSFTSVTGATGAATHSGGNQSVAGTTPVGAGGKLPGAGATGSSSGGATGQGGTSSGSGGTSKSAGGMPAGSTGGIANTGGSKSSTGGASLGGSPATGGSSASGGTSSGGLSGSGGSSQFLPCPTNGDACIILPFGDSITDGIGSTDSAGYRAPLFKLIVAANQKINFVGSRSSGPTMVSGKTFPKNHEGHPGWTIDSGYVSYGDGISTLIPSPAFSTIPHIVLLMIGTNDVNGTKGTDTIADRLDVLLGKIIAVAPNALVVVAQPTPIRAGSAPLATYNSKIPALIQKRAANGQHVVSVDMSKMPTSSLASDGIHPNDTGYAYMADIWYAAIKGLLPK